jgi:hypothetical protein
VDVREVRPQVDQPPMGLEAPMVDESSAMRLARCVFGSFSTSLLDRGSVMARFTYRRSSTLLAVERGLNHAEGLIEA